MPTCDGQETAKELEVMRFRRMHPWPCAINTYHEILSAHIFISKLGECVQVSTVFIITTNVVRM